MLRKCSWFLIVYFLSVRIAFSQEVQITEVQPFSVGTEPEWFEFFVRTEGEGIDISEWKIANGKNHKIIGDFREKLIFPPNFELLSGSGYTQKQIVIPPDEAVYISWEKSPISLPDGGGMVQVFDSQDVMLAERIYPKGKSGKRKGYAYSEVFNWSGISPQVYPLIFRENGGTAFSHTKGFMNQKSPTLPEEVQVLISEISPDREDKKGGDFIEFYFATGPEKINLKYAEIKHNGTTLYFFEDDFWVLPQQFLTLWVGKDFSGIVKNTAPYEIYSDKKAGLSVGSGTVELILFSDTSFEKTEDFVCYMDGVLSKTERARVEKNMEYWKSPCIDIANLIPNQSIARVGGWVDRDRESDFFPHYNGTPSRENIIENDSPRAIITVQGSGKVEGVSPFSVNLTGEDSTDPNGEKDLKRFIWKMNGEIFSEEINPKNFKLEALGEYLVELEVQDFSGVTDRVSQIFSVVPPGSAPKGSLSKGGKLFITQALLPVKKKGKENQDDGFFADFLAQAPESFWTEVQTPPIPISSFDPRGNEIPEGIDLVAQEAERRKKWIAKNIGWAFVEEF